MNGNGNRFALDNLSCSCEFVEFFASDFFGRVHRRDLEEGASEFLKMGEYGLL